MAIDDPLEKIQQIVDEGNGDPLDVALRIGGSASPFLGMLSVVKEALDSNQQGHRIRTAIIALADEMNRLQDRRPKDLNAIFESVWFIKMVKSLLKACYVQCFVLAPPGLRCCVLPTGHHSHPTAPT